MTDNSGDIHQRSDSFESICSTSFKSFTSTDNTEWYSGKCDDSEEKDSFFTVTETYYSPEENNKETHCDVASSMTCKTCTQLPTVIRCVKGMFPNRRANENKRQNNNVNSKPKHIDEKFNVKHYKQHNVNKNKGGINTPSSASNSQGESSASDARSKTATFSDLPSTTSGQDTPETTAKKKRKKKRKKSGSFVSQIYMGTSSMRNVGEGQDEDDLTYVLPPSSSNSPDEFEGKDNRSKTFNKPSSSKENTEDTDGDKKSSQKNSQKSSRKPSRTASKNSSKQPSQKSSQQSSQRPSQQHSQQPSQQHSQNPSQQPSQNPSKQPSKRPSQQTSQRPSRIHSQQNVSVAQSAKTPRATRFVIENPESGALTDKVLTEVPGHASCEESGPVYVCRLGRVVDDGSGGLSVSIISGPQGASGYFKDPASHPSPAADSSQPTTSLVKGSLVYVCRLVRNSATNDVDMSKALDHTTLDYGLSGVCGRVCRTKCNSGLLRNARRTLDHCRKVKSQFLSRHGSIKEAVNDSRQKAGQKDTIVEDKHLSSMKEERTLQKDKPNKTYFFRGGTVARPKILSNYDAG